MRTVAGSLERWRSRAAELRDEIAALRMVVRDPRVPRRAKLMTGLVLTYAVSPIDLIPDFLPVIGQLDDLLVVPLGLALSLRMIPTDILSECRAEVARQREDTGDGPASAERLLPVRARRGLRRRTRYGA